MSYRIDIKVGYTCNNHCQFCVAGDKRSKFPDKSSREIASILEKRRHKYDEVVFTGGEATIRDDFFELVSYARRLGYTTIQIQSNGRMFAYEDFCKRTVKAGADYFALALHGSRKQVHDTLTRAPGSFDQVVRGIKNLKGLQQKVVLNTVINKINYKDLPAIARLLVSLGVDQFQFAFIHINPAIQNDPRSVAKIVPRKSDVAAYVKRGLQIGIDRNLMVMAEAIPYCFLNGYEDCVSEKFIPLTSVEGEDFLDNFNQYRKQEAKMQGPPCAGCAYNSVCEGPWKEYPQIFGWSEFIPVAKQPPDRRRTYRPLKQCHQV